jgi:hypothetical protein
MFSRVLVLALALGAASAFQTSFGSRARGAALGASLKDVLTPLDGPAIKWGYDADPTQGIKEADVKGYESFKTFAAAMDSSGLIKSGKEYTIFAPTDSSLEGTSLTEDVLKYHMVEGKVPKGSIAGDLKSCSGKALTYKYFARQTFLDQAVIGETPQGAATGEVFPTDVEADGCLIHTIRTPLDPAWTKMDLNTGADPNA